MDDNITRWKSQGRNGLCLPTAAKMIVPGPTQNMTGIIYLFMVKALSQIIRPAREEDVIRLADLADQLGHPSPIEQIHERFEILTKKSDSNVIFVAEADQKTVGWVHAHIYNMLVDDPKLEIGGLVVDEKFRSHGVGEKLVQAVEAWAIEKGCFNVYIRSNIIRTRAHEFYKRIGYTMIKSHYIFRKVLK